MMYTIRKCNRGHDGVCVLSSNKTRHSISYELERRLGKAIVDLGVLK
jgi:hypothetical protein